MLDLVVAASAIKPDSPREMFTLLHELRDNFAFEVGRFQRISYGLTEGLEDAKIRVEERREKIERREKTKQKVREFCEAAKKLAVEAQRLVDLQSNDDEADPIGSGLGSRKRKREDSEKVTEEWEDLHALDKEWEELEVLHKRLRK